MSTTETIPAPLRMAQRLGKRILGEQAVEKITAAKRRGALRLGSRVTGAAKPAEVSAPTREGDGYLSIPEMRSLLATTPDALDSFIAAELAEGHTRRKGALSLFLEVERAKGDATRAEVVAAIEDALK